MPIDDERFAMDLVLQKLRGLQELLRVVPAEPHAHMQTAVLFIGMVLTKNLTCYFLPFRFRVLKRTC